MLHLSYNRYNKDRHLIKRCHRCVALPWKYTDCTLQDNCYQAWQHSNQKCFGTRNCGFITRRIGQTPSPHCCWPSLGPCALARKAAPPQHLLPPYLLPLLRDPLPPLCWHSPPSAYWPPDFVQLCWHSGWRSPRAASESMRAAGQRAVLVSCQGGQRVAWADLVYVGTCLKSWPKGQISWAESLPLGLSETDGSPSRRKQPTAGHI